MRSRPRPIEKRLVGLRILGVALLDGFRFLGAEMQIERLRDFQGGLFLQREDVFHFAGEIVGPDLEAGGRVDQVDIDADLIAGFADGAFEQVTHT